MKKSKIIHHHHYISRKSKMSVKKDYFPCSCLSHLINTENCSCTTCKTIKGHRIGLAQDTYVQVQFCDCFDCINTRRECQCTECEQIRLMLPDRYDNISMNLLAYNSKLKNCVVKPQLITNSCFCRKTEEMLFEKRNRPLKLPTRAATVEEQKQRYDLRFQRNKPFVFKPSTLTVKTVKQLLQETTRTAQQTSQLSVIEEVPEPSTTQLPTQGDIPSAQQPSTTQLPTQGDIPSAQQPSTTQLPTQDIDITDAQRLSTTQMPPSTSNQIPATQTPSASQACQQTPKSTNAKTAQVFQLSSLAVDERVVTGRFATSMFVALVTYRTRETGKLSFKISLISISISILVNRLRKFADIFMDDFSSNSSFSTQEIYEQISEDDIRDLNLLINRILKPEYPTRIKERLRAYLINELVCIHTIVKEQTSFDVFKILIKPPN